MTQALDHEVPKDADGEAAERDWLLEEVRSEAEAMDVGQLPRTPEEAEVYRYLRRRAQLAGEIERIQEQTAALVKQLKAKLDGLDYLYRPGAEDFARKMLGRGKSRSVKTPFGVIGFRKRAAKLEVADEAKLLAAAERDMDLIGLVREFKEVNRTALAEHFKTTGEIPPGTALVPEADVFYLK